jgi:hypothetical protein
MKAGQGSIPIGVGVLLLDKNPLSYVKSRLSDVENETGIACSCPNTIHNPHKPVASISPFQFLLVWKTNQPPKYSIYTSEPNNKEEYPRSCVPELLDSLGDAHVVGLEGVQRDAQGDGAEPQEPHGNAAGHRYAVLGEVVNDA